MLEFYYLVVGGCCGSCLVVLWWWCCSYNMKKDVCSYQHVWIPIEGNNDITKKKWNEI